MMALTFVRTRFDSHLINSFISPFIYDHKMILKYKAIMYVVLFFISITHMKKEEIRQMCFLNIGH